MNERTHACVSGHERLKRVLDPLGLELHGGFGLPYVVFITQSLVTQQEPLTTEPSLPHCYLPKTRNMRTQSTVGESLPSFTSVAKPSGKGEKEAFICLSLLRGHLGTILKKCMGGWRDLRLSWRKQEAAADLSHALARLVWERACSSGHTRSLLMVRGGPTPGSGSVVWVQTL